MKKKMCQMVLPLLSAFGVGFYLENLPTPVPVILLVLCRHRTLQKLDSIAALDSLRHLLRAAVCHPCQLLDKPAMP
jgi:hypothetical protein